LEIFLKTIYQRNLPKQTKELNINNLNLQVALITLLSEEKEQEEMPFQEIKESKSIDLRDKRLEHIQKGI
jgi:hypothetical protein